MKQLLLLFSVMSIKLYLCPSCGKRTKFTSRLIRYPNTCKSHRYPRNLMEIPQKYPNYKEENTSGRNWEKEKDWRDRMAHISNANGSINESPIEDIPTKDMS